MWWQSNAVDSWVVDILYLLAKGAFSSVSTCWLILNVDGSLPFILYTFTNSDKVMQSFLCEMVSQPKWKWTLVTWQPCQVLFTLLKHKFTRQNMIKSHSPLVFPRLECLKFLPPPLERFLSSSEAIFSVVLWMKLSQCQTCQSTHKPKHCESRNATEEHLSLAKLAPTSGSGTNDETPYKLRPKVKGCKTMSRDQNKPAIFWQVLVSSRWSLNSKRYSTKSKAIPEYRL